MTRGDKAFAFACGLILAGLIVFTALNAWSQPVNTCCIPQSDARTLRSLDAGLRTVETRLNAARGDAGTVIVAYADGGFGPLNAETGSGSPTDIRFTTAGAYSYLKFGRVQHNKDDLVSGVSSWLYGGNSGGEIGLHSSSTALLYLTSAVIGFQGANLQPVTATSAASPPYSFSAANTSGLYALNAGQFANSYIGTAQGRIGQDATFHECVPLASTCANTTDFQPSWTVPEGMAGAGSAAIDCAIETAGTGSGTQSLIVWDSTVGADAGSAVVAVTASCTTTGNVAGVTQSTLNLLAGRQVTLRWNKGACTTAGAGIRCTVRWK